MDDSQLTRVMQQAQEGDEAARNQLFELIYDELHRQAERIVRDKGPAAEASSLIHEGFLQLFRDDHKLDIPNRRYFYFCAARKMRDILVERIRKQHRRPAASPLDQLSDQFLDDFRAKTHWDFLALHDALNRFSRSRNERKRRRHELIDLEFFSGLTLKEAAKLVGISYSQAREDKRLALAELQVELEKLQP